MLKGEKNILGVAKLPISISCIIVTNFCRGAKFFQGGSAPPRPPLVAALAKIFGIIAVEPALKISHHSVLLKFERNDKKKANILGEN